MNWLFREPQRNPRLGEALRQVERQSELDDAGLRQRIVDAAVPRLAVLRWSSPRWWEWISRWMPVAVPLGLAASLAAALLVPQAEDNLTAQTYTAEAAADSTLVLAAYSEEPGDMQIAAHLVAPEPGDWLLEEAVGR
jgi:hypothetical protein